MPPGGGGAPPYGTPPPYGSPPYATMPQQPAPQAPPPQGPAGGRDDAKALKRWVAVAVVWAIAATAVALIALFNGSSSDAENRAEEADSRVSDLQRTFDRRLDNLESRVGSLPQPADQSRLNDRLARLEDQASKATEDAKRASQKLSDLENSVGSDDGQSGDDDTDSTPTTPDLPDIR